MTEEKKAIVKYVERKREHWTEEPPTKPGWYRVRLKNYTVYQLQRFTINNDKKLYMDMFDKVSGHWIEALSIEEIKDVYSHFWSEPERDLGWPLGQEKYYEAETAIPWKKEGWTKDIPGRPGWYKAVRYDGDFCIVEIKVDEDGDALKADGLSLDSYKYWWSEEEEVPVIPREET